MLKFVFYILALSMANSACSKKSPSEHVKDFHKTEILNTVQSVESSKDSKKDSILPANEKPLLQLFSGFLRLKTDSKPVNVNVVTIYNTHGTVFGNIPLNSIEPSFQGDSAFSIWSYYPDYFIVIFEADSITSDKRYPIRVNNSLKYIEHIEGLTVYENTSEHLQSSFIGTDKANPLRKEPSLSSDLVEESIDYSGLSFELQRIQGDWGFVICNAACEGCPTEVLDFSGWIQILNNGKAIVKIYYAC
ncbi:hypothetical protein QWY85_12150 [Neolewinella lacunae]|uniref:Uncharacterized protein n=1 Tax=Neolewinella lacunae TaxID=1517758 RepID=A0A923T9Z0_9BACT|nr:hypothetical protein [Neolewinella lacunae]MBC6996026.1 hypothetical protein [Neolewinella lacunae]MDN3635415.1 hypothetical protein [Neolewinella lacunae]